MAKLKLGPILNERPVRITLELPATVHRDLLAYADLLQRETGQVTEAAQIVAPMLARFMATDRGFAKSRPLSPGRRSAPPTDGSERAPSSRSS